MATKNPTALSARRENSEFLGPNLVAEWIERLIELVEVIIVLSAGIGLLFVGWWLFIEWLFCDPIPSRRAAAAKAAAETLGQNWQVMLLALLPIFYRPVRAFAEDVYEAFGMKRRLREPETTVEANPPSRTESNGSPDA